MKFTPSFFKNFGAIVAVIGLAGCAAATGSPESHPHKAHHAAGAMTSSSMPMGHRMTGGDMDRKSMCDMHSKMMSEKTPEERKAMVEAHHGNMSAADMQRHMEMMQEKCH